MSFLVPCEACRRHVLASELRCPFCAAQVTESMRVPRALAVPRSRLGRAAMLVLGSTAAATTAGCGGDSEGNNAREQASEPSEPGPGATQPEGSDPDPTDMSQLPPSPSPTQGNPVMTPDGEPMAVAEYGVAILPPAPTMGADPPSPDPNLVPRPVYGAPALPPAPSATMAPAPVPEPSVEPEPQVEPEPPVSDAGPAPLVDAGAADAGAAVPVPEPEPVVVPAYGVPALPVE